MNIINAIIGGAIKMSTSQRGKKQRSIKRSKTCMRRKGIQTRLVTHPDYIHRGRS
jgi:hypothetical protein